MILVSKSERAKKISRAIAHMISVEIASSEDEIVVIGGDGFLLESIRKFGDDKIYIPLNAGYLGFRLNDVWNKESQSLIPNVQEQINERAWSIRSFPLLSVILSGPERDSKELFASNDVFVERQDLQTCRLSVSVNGSKLVENMIGDGIIASTPIGSTAYNLSSGGPVLYPTGNSVALTAINPHSPKFPSMVLPASAKIEIKANEFEHRPTRIAVDGNGFSGYDKVGVSMSNKFVRIAYFHNHDFLERIMTKVVR